MDISFNGNGLFSTVANFVTTSFIDEQPLFQNSFTTKKDKWELNAISNNNLIANASSHKENNRIKYILVYEMIETKKDSSELTPTIIPARSFFDLSVSYVPNMLHNKELLFSNGLIPCSMITYLTSTKPSNNVCFIEFVFNKKKATMMFWKNGYNIDSNNCNIKFYQTLSKQFLRATIPNSKDNVSGAETLVSVFQQNIIAYTINTLRLKLKECCDIAYLVFEKGTFLSKKEEKKKMFLFNELEVINKQSYHTT